MGAPLLSKWQLYARALKELVATPRNWKPATSGAQANLFGQSRF